MSLLLLISTMFRELITSVLLMYYTRQEEPEFTVFKTQPCQTHSGPIRASLHEMYLIGH